MSEKFYITTPIYYVNSHPHIGHAYTSIVVDIFRRFRKLFGQDTYFLTGTDEHGQKIAESAEERNITPQAFVDEVSQEFKDMWPHLHVEYDQFIRTTDADHKAKVQQVLQKIYDQGEIYLKQYEGLYCVGCERFLDDSELVEGKCPDHQKEPVQHKEENYFFKMSAYQEWLLQMIEENEDWIYPKRYRNEVIQFLKEPLQDLCISRPKSRLTWGIELPFDDNFVTYVWFDALLNYPNAVGWPDGELYEKYWPHVHHMIGKDILKTHAIYWPCMMKSAGISVFQKLIVHGHWISSGAKMSKSLGNVIDPLAMKDKVGVDPLRYFLARDMSFGEDANFTEELLLVRYNGDLANNIGNLISRSVAMSRKSFDGLVPPQGTLGDLENELHANFKEGIEQVKTHLLNFHLHRALEQVSSMASLVNKYIDTTAPWKLAKDENAKGQLGTVLYTALDSVRILLQLLAPVMPEKMATAWDTLGLSEDALKQANLELSQMVAGQVLKAPVPLFPKIKPAAAEPEKTEKKNTKKVAKEELPPLDPPEHVLTFDEFTKVDLKVGKILACQKVKKSDKLLHSQVDLGEFRPRSIVSGIAEHYAPEDLVGKNVVVVSNLKPAKLRGVLSEGMILCSDTGEQLAVVEASAEATPGTPVL